MPLAPRCPAASLLACSYSAGCDGGDVIDVIRYMKHYGLPDTSCMPCERVPGCSAGAQLSPSPAAAVKERCAATQAQLFLCSAPFSAPSPYGHPQARPPPASCCADSADDYTKYGRTARRCPADGYCMNCMPLQVGEQPAPRCWALAQ